MSLMANFEQVLHIVLVFCLLILNKKIPVEKLVMRS